MLRIDPLGRDNKGNAYYYFSGVRLWKEAPTAADNGAARKRGRAG